MSEEHCQVSDGFIAMMSTVKLEELEDIEKGLRLIEKMAGDLMAGRITLDDSLPTIRAVAEIHRARLQRQRREWESASCFRRVAMAMKARRERMSEFVCSEIARTTGS